jgi:hypothetical protein
VVRNYSRLQHRTRPSSGFAVLDTTFPDHSPRYSCLSHIFHLQFRPEFSVMRAVDRGMRCPTISHVYFLRCGGSLVGGVVACNLSADIYESLKRQEGHPRWDCLASGPVAHSALVYTEFARCGALAQICAQKQVTQMLCRIRVASNSSRWRPGLSWPVLFVVDCFCRHVPWINTPMTSITKF